MSLCDPYHELLLYLEQTSDEIAKVFEKRSPQLSEAEAASKPFQFDVQSNINELYTRYKQEVAVNQEDKSHIPYKNDTRIPSTNHTNTAVPKQKPNNVEETNATICSDVIDIIKEFQKLTSNTDAPGLNLNENNIPPQDLDGIPRAPDVVARFNGHKESNLKFPPTTIQVCEAGGECRRRINFFPSDNEAHKIHGIVSPTVWQETGAVPKSIYLTDVKQESHLLYPEDVSNEVLIQELSGSQTTIHSDGDSNPHNPVTAATQTLSQSSTNLTWSSDCSSSPCLTSDLDVPDDNNRSSSSSAEGTAKSSQWLSDQWQQELGTKSSSAPVLKKVEPEVTKQTRSQSDRQLAEIEATEACKWLKAAGFPQYAQIYEELHFPIDLDAVVHDHPMLEPAVLQSLFRRLKVLNRCANVHQRVTHIEDSEDEQFALSENWTYQSDLRRWSRTCQDVEMREKPGEPNNRERWCNSLPHPRLEGMRLKDHWKEKCRRSGSIKPRRRHDSVGGNESTSNVLELLTKQLVDLKSASVEPSPFKRGSKYVRRRKARSLDKSEGWSLPSTPEKFVWHSEEGESFERRGGLNLENARPIASLSCMQLQVLRKLALLKVTAYMEKYCPSHRTGWNWDFTKFIRRMKSPVYKEKTVFGLPLSVVFQRIGQNLPRNIEEALLWLKKDASEQVGLFRKPGVRSRIATIRNYVDVYEGIPNFEDQQAYDVADMVKQYFRELPEALLTNKLSETFIHIFQYVPTGLRMEALLCAMLLIPDEHREVLQILMHFLKHVAQQSAVNQMTESNLAMCFAPSLFHFNQSGKQSLGTPHPKELAANKAAHECLHHILKHDDVLFSIPQELIDQCKASEIKDYKAVQLYELGTDTHKNWVLYLEECQAALLKEARDKSRGWVVVPGHFPKVEVAYKKVADGHPLRLWRASSEIEAPPREVLHRILRERHLWDPDLLLTKVVAQLDANVEVFQYVRRKIAPLPDEDYCVVRSWKANMPKDACLVVETSVEHHEAVEIPDSVRGIVLASRYLIEPGGSGKSRIVHMSRADMRGRMPQWYHKNYGHLVGLFMSKLLMSFQQVSGGPESQV